MRYIYVFNDGFHLARRMKILRIIRSFLVCIIRMMVLCFLFVCFLVLLTSGYPGGDHDMTGDHKFALDVQKVK